MQEHRTSGEDGPSSDSRDYKVFVLDAEGHVTRTIAFRAFGDAAAMAIAEGLVNGRSVELWEGLRYIERYDPEPGQVTP